MSKKELSNVTPASATNSKILDVVAFCYFWCSGIQSCDPYLFKNLGMLIWFCQRIKNLDNMVNQNRKVLKKVQKYVLQKTGYLKNKPSSKPKKKWKSNLPFLIAAWAVSWFFSSAPFHLVLAVWLSCGHPFEETFSVLFKRKTNPLQHHHQKDLLILVFNQSGAFNSTRIVSLTLQIKLTSLAM